MVNSLTKNTYMTNGTKLAFTPFYQTIQHFTPFPKLIREMHLFETKFSQNRVKKKKKNSGAL